MEEYRFEHKEPLTQRVVLALRVNTKQLKEQLWLGTEYEVEVALRGLDKPLYLAQTRPLGAFWCEFGETSADGWTEAVWTLWVAGGGRGALGGSGVRLNFFPSWWWEIPPLCMRPFKFGRCTCATAEEGINIKQKLPCGIMRNC